MMRWCWWGKHSTRKSHQNARSQSCKTAPDATPLVWVQVLQHHFSHAVMGSQVWVTPLKNVRPRDLTHQVTSIVQRSGSAYSVQGERGMPYVGVVPAIVNATRTLIKSDISGQNIMFVIISTSRATNLYFQTCAQTSHVKILTWPQ